AHWAGRYEGIRRANIFLENIDRVTVLTETEKRTLLAQARFIRAWHYFYLTQLFGDVPLITHQISIEEALKLTRTDKATVDKFIDTELQYAIDNLPASYPAAETGRITKGAAVAFKSRFHLYNGQDEQAAQLASTL